MVSYMNLHLAFEQMRVKSAMAARNSPSLDLANDVPDGPPRVLILGPENAGKTTACKTLTNYAVRTGQGWAPMFVNVDPSEVCHAVFPTRCIAQCSWTSGSLYGPRNDLCLPNIHFCTDYVSCKPPWLDCDISTHSKCVLSTAANGVLVRPSRSQAKPHSDGETDTQHGRARSC